MLVHVMVAGPAGRELDELHEEVLNLDHMVRGTLFHGKDAWWLNVEFTKDATAHASPTMIWVDDATESGQRARGRVNELARRGVEANEVGRPIWQPAL